MRRNLALAAGSLLVALVLVEITLRAVSFTELVAGPPVGLWKWTRYDPVLGHGNVPGYRMPALDMAINALGFRGAEITRRKPPGVVRVVCLGDSTTLGIWVEAPGDMRANRPYPAEVERLARADGLPVEVINGGILGQTSAGALVQLLTQVLPLEPDVVTLRVGNNDHGWSRNIDAVLATRWEYPVLHAMPAFAWRLETMRLLFHVYRQAIAYHRRLVHGELRVGPDRFEENLRRFVTVAREHGIHLAFVDFPYRELDRGPSPGETFPNVMQNVRSLEELHALHDSYQAVVARVASETGTPLVRTRDAMRTAPEPTFSAHDLSHPNAAGYGVVAQRIYTELRGLGWLEPRR